MKRTVNTNVGFKFPFGFSEGKTQTSGGTAYETPTNDELDVAARGGVQQIVLTERGERVMLCNLGVGLGRFLFHPLSTQMTGLVLSETREQLGLWCSRAAVTMRGVKMSPGEGSLVVFGSLRHNSASSDGEFEVGVQA